MIEEVFPKIFRIEIPLPRSPLKALNSYFVKGRERSLMIDTGQNRAECIQAMSAGLEELNVDLDKTDFFITHWHADHLGLVGDLATNTSKVYLNWREVSMLNAAMEGERWQRYFLLYLRHGFPEEELRKALDSHPGRRLSLKKRVDFCTVKDGDIIEIGDYSFRCMETPGHSPGHTCLYETDKKILIAGDHILIDITPNITYRPEPEDSLQQYLASLDKVYALDVNLVLPGHRSLIRDHRKRIRELQDHHQARLNEALRALEKGPKSAFEVAPLLTWDIEFRSWEQLPVQQKYFAFGETLAHLKYLEGRGMVLEEKAGTTIQFSLV